MNRIITATIVGVATLSIAGGLLIGLVHDRPAGDDSRAISAGTAGPAGPAPAGSVASAPTASSITPPPPPPSTAPRAAGATRPPTTAAPTTVATAVHPTVPTTAAAAAPASPVPAAPGTYRYRQVGSLAGTPAVGTLTVSPVSAAGTQVWTRAVGGTVAPSSSVMLFNSSGSFLVSPGSQSPCTFAAPVPWPPWPTTPGQHFSGRANCTGAVTSYVVSGAVQGTASLPLDGRSVVTSVVVNTIVLTGSADGSALNVTLTETDYYAGALRVPVQTKTHVSGTAIGLTITTDRTDTLESANPT